MKLTTFISKRSNTFFLLKSRDQNFMLIPSQKIPGFSEIPSPKYRDWKFLILLGPASGASTFLLDPPRFLFCFQGLFFCVEAESQDRRRRRRRRSGATRKRGRRRRRLGRGWGGCAAGSTAAAAEVMGYCWRPRSSSVASPILQKHSQFGTGWNSFGELLVIMDIFQERIVKGGCTLHIAHWTCLQMCREGEDNESLHVSAARGPDLREKSPQTVLGSTIISWLSRKSQILGPSSQLKKYFAYLWREKAEINIVGIVNAVFESLPQTQNHSWLKNTKTKIYWSTSIFFETIQW